MKPVIVTLLANAAGPRYILRQGRAYDLPKRLAEQLLREGLHEGRAKRPAARLGNQTGRPVEAVHWIHENPGAPADLED
jgi:hypothetical protein